MFSSQQFDLSITRLEVPVRDANNNRVGVHIYYYDEEHKLGEGGSGVVYKGIRVKEDDDDEEELRPYAIKVIPKSIYDPIEVKILSQFYFVEEPVIMGENVFLVMEFLPGKHCDADEYKNLTLYQRINLINQIVADVFLLHHNRLTGKAVFHGDLKRENINITRSQQGLEASILDFGLAGFVENDNPNALVNTNIQANPDYFPIETLNGNFGVKTDVYMLVSVIAELLGELNSFKLKAESRPRPNRSNRPHSMPIFGKQRNHFQRAAIPYAINDIMTFPDLYPGIEIRTVVLQFLNRMQRNKVEERPEIHEVLHFFTALNQLVKLHEKMQQSIETRVPLVAKMLILSFNLCRLNIGSPHRPKQLIEFDFKAYPNVCDIIIERAKLDTLNFLIIKPIREIIRKSQQRQCQKLNLKMAKKISSHSRLMRHPLMAAIDKKHKEFVSKLDADDAYTFTYEVSHQAYQLISKLDEMIKLSKQLILFPDTKSSIEANLEAGLIAYHQMNYNQSQVEIEKSFNKILSLLDESIIFAKDTLRNADEKEKEFLLAAMTHLTGSPLYSAELDEVKKLVEQPPGCQNAIEDLFISLYLKSTIYRQDKTFFSSPTPADARLAWLEKKLPALFPKISETVLRPEIENTLSHRILFYLGETYWELAENIHRCLDAFKIEDTSNKNLFLNMAKLLRNLGNGGFALASELFTKGKSKNQFISDGVILKFYDEKLELTKQNKKLAGSGQLLMPG